MKNSWADFRSERKRERERVGCTKTSKTVVSIHVPPTVLEEPSKGCDSLGSDISMRALI
jgi:hypothetical protein